MHYNSVNQDTLALDHKCVLRLLAGEEGVPAVRYARVFACDSQLFALRAPRKGNDSTRGTETSEGQQECEWSRVRGGNFFEKAHRCQVYSAIVLNSTIKYLNQSRFATLSTGQPGYSATVPLQFYKK